MFSNMFTNFFRFLGYPVVGLSLGTFRLKEPEDNSTFVARDYYGDCSKSLMEVAIVFLTQFSLLVFFLLGLFDGGDPDFSNGRTFAFYYAGWRTHVLPHL